MLKKFKAFWLGLTTAKKPYKTVWASFDELAAYDNGREVALLLFWR